jgi:RNA polymerase sigma-70 factor (ECF subfamily)
LSTPLSLAPTAASVEDPLDEAALVRVLEEGAPRLRTLARRMLGDADDAGDALQEAWIRAWGRREQLRTAAAVHAWTRVIVVRECLRVLRWRAVRRWLPFGADVPDVPAPGPGADGVLAAAQVARRARSAAEHLPPRQRLCWGLRFDEGWSVAEIAAATGLAPDTVKTHLGRALAAVQEAVHGL